MLRKFLALLMPEFMALSKLHDRGIMAQDLVKVLEGAERDAVSLATGQQVAHQIGVLTAGPVRVGYGVYFVRV